MTLKLTRRAALQGMLAGTAALTTMRAFPAWAQAARRHADCRSHLRDRHHERLFDRLPRRRPGGRRRGPARARQGRPLRARARHRSADASRTAASSLSEDGKTMKITYKLREGVKWHDGEPFTSADVKYTWEAVKDPAFIAESKDGTEEVESIDTPDDLTVIVNYNTIAARPSPRRCSPSASCPSTCSKAPTSTPRPTTRPRSAPARSRSTEFVRGQYVVTDRNDELLAHGRERRHSCPTSTASSSR